jgi:hypothetical protein
MPTAMSWAVFSWSERRIVIWPASGGSFLRQLAADPDLVGQVGDQAAEVEGDFAFRRRHRFFLVFEHGEQLFVCRPVGVFPEAFRGRALQHLFGAAARNLAQPAGHRARELLRFAGQDAFEFFFDVDVFVELVDQVVADGGADRFVLDQAPAGVDPVVGVERLALGPDREDAEEGEQ